MYRGCCPTQMISGEPQSAVSLSAQHVSKPSNLTSNNSPQPLLLNGNQTETRTTGHVIKTYAVISPKGK